MLPSADSSLLTHHPARWQVRKGGRCKFSYSRRKFSWRRHHWSRVTAQNTLVSRARLYHLWLLLRCGRPPDHLQ
jgi:hypothetical protein